MNNALTLLVQLLDKQLPTPESVFQVGDFLCLCRVKGHSSSTQPPNVSEFKTSKFLAAIKQLQSVYHDTKPEWLEKIGLGIVCVCRDGIAEKSLVGYYWGKMSAYHYHYTCSFYALSQILESHNLSGVRRKLERPLLMRSTICCLKFLLVVLVVTTFCAKPPLPPLPQLHHHHHYLKHFPFSFCRTIDAQDEYNFVSRMYVTVFLPLISAARSLTSPQKSFVQSQ
jgi:hypothetical protein